MYGFIVGRWFKMAIEKVEPLRTKKEISDFKWALERYCGQRDLFLFNFGINTGLRISDIVPLKVSDVKDKERLVIREQKTNKVRRLKFPVKLIEDIDDYVRGMKDDDYLFPSKKGGHITTTQAYRQLQKAADVLDRDDIGTHTMRKTFGYHHYKLNKDVVKLQKIFNHSYPSITLRYIGIEQEELDQTMEGFYL